MSTIIERAQEQPVASHANHATERPHRQAAPRWMTWAPLAAIAWAVVYGAVRVAVPAYLAWGLGLGAAAIGYYQVTPPQCQVCGR